MIPYVQHFAWVGVHTGCAFTDVRTEHIVLIVLVKFVGLSTSLASGGMLCRPSVGATGRDDVGGVSIASQFTRAMPVMSSLGLILLLRCGSEAL